MGTWGIIRVVKEIITFQGSRPNNTKQQVLTRLGRDSSRGFSLPRQQVCVAKKVHCNVEDVRV